MKKVLYLYAVEEGLGIINKALKIEQGFRTAGCALTVLSLIFHKKKRKRFFQLVNYFMKLAKVVRRETYDVVFVRNSYYFILIYGVFLILGIKIQVEINTKEKEEFLARKQPVRALIASAALYLAIKSSCKVHAVTHELVNHYQELYPAARFVYNANFVLNESYGAKRAPKAGDKINIVFLGNTKQKWQGIDLFIQRVIAGNEWFVDNCNLNIIGFCDGRIEDMAEANSLQDTIICHGYRVGADMDRVMAKMDVGIACFRLDFKALKEATPIKVGDYLYSGLPVIIGYDDSRLNESLDFVLRIDIEDDENELRRQVNSFVRRVRIESSLNQKAHEWAEKNLLVANYIHKIIN